MKNLLFLFFSLLLCSPLWAKEDKRPNFLIILVDDMGFSDLGCYGSEIETPNLDSLAANGLRFSQFYNTAKCHSSRISLLTSQYYLPAGNNSLKNSVTAAEVLNTAGYHTMMSGKWHLDNEPTDFGFQRYFGHLSGATNFFSGDDTFRLNGKPWKVPSEGFYTTVTKVGFAIDFLKEAETIDKPWYMYLALNAPHAPIQPLNEDYEKFKGKYDVGWDVLREQRMKKQRELGIFKNPVKESPRPNHIPAWDDLTPEWQSSEARRLAAVSAMIYRIDVEVGRLVKHIEAAGDLDNTMILFVSDNGACPFGTSQLDGTTKPFSAKYKWRDSSGPAWMRNAPFKFYKQNQHEGGISTPAILHWPAGLKTAKGSINHTPTHLIDVLPTMIDMSQATYPSEWPGRKLNPMTGESFLPIIEGGDVTRKNPIHFWYSTNRGLRDGKWKIASINDSPWELYDMETDRAELNNLAKSNPELTKRMAEQWNTIAAENYTKKSAFTAQDDLDNTQYFNKRWTDYTKNKAKVANKAK